MTDEQFLRGTVMLMGSMLFCMWIYIKHLQKLVDDGTNCLRWYANWFILRQGYWCGYGDYTIASFDCGRVWWNVEMTDDAPIQSKGRPVRQHGFKIISPADAVLVDFIKKGPELTITMRLGGEDVR